MKDIPKIDYSDLDRPEILLALFHPRPEWKISDKTNSANDFLIPVEKNVVVNARFYLAEKTAPNILFFHGNGEIVSDYDELGPIYNSMGINFLPVDYRGYGRSTGRPTVTAMMRDCHVIFRFIKSRLNEKDYSGRFIIMGRSLGSASALEIAANYKAEIDALIIESGFAHLGPLLELLGVDVNTAVSGRGTDLQNIDKIKAFHKPTLIIHAEKDHIIPFSEGQTLYENCGAAHKFFLKIPGANHNDIFIRGFREYMSAIKTLVFPIKGPPERP